MAYISPFHFLEPVPGKTNFNSVDLQRARKRVLAEFELNGSALLESFSRHEMLEWLDHLPPEELGFHQFIFTRKPLLNFLENGELSNQDWVNSFPALVPGTPQHDFISRLVAEKYDRLFAEAFEENNLSQIVKLLHFHLPEGPDRYRQYYGTTIKQLSSLHRQLQGQIKALQEGKVESAEIHPFLKKSFLDCLNALPDFFQPMRDEMSTSLYRLAVEAADDKNKQLFLSAEVLRAAEQIQVTIPVLKSNERLKKEKIKSKGVPGTESSGSSWGWIRWVITFVILSRILAAIF